MIRVLDCTLRDGGYCNQWRFGKENIAKIIKSLLAAGIDIIECGFLTNKVDYDANSTQFPSLDVITGWIPPEMRFKFVAMINYGEYCLDDIPLNHNSPIDGIRVAFHKKNMIPALDFCKGIKRKGYKVFIQAMVSLNYTDEEFLSLIRRVNELKPYAFYIVDSFGVMKRKDLLRLFYMVEHNLDEEIAIGYHSHNNMQLSYSNAQMLTDIRTGRDIIIDSSVFGMGRGAGNLNTELFVEYLNDNIAANYELQPLLSIIDESLVYFYQHSYWGYSLPLYLSASLSCHPNYAIYFAEKNTLPVKAFYELLHSISDEDKVSFAKTKAEQYYRRYMDRFQNDDETIQKLSDIFHGKEVLLLASGKSIIEYRNAIRELSEKENALVISVNFYDEKFKSDFIFISNMRRFSRLPLNTRAKIIATSNIVDREKADYVVNYANYISQQEKVMDNAGLMALRLLSRIGVPCVRIAGMDGYSSSGGNNYFSIDTERPYSPEAEIMNKCMSQELRELSKDISIQFITPTQYSL